jgi:hypothetical protein
VFVLYARAEAELKPVKGGEVRLTLTWTSPWWQGVFGPGRTRKAINTLADRLEKYIRKDGFEVLERKLK